MIYWHSSSLKKMFIPRYVIEDFAISFDDLERRSCILNNCLYVFISLVIVFDDLEKDVLVMYYTS